MSKGKYIGGLEESVLIAIHSLGSDAYGVTIHEAMRNAGRILSIGSLYVTLGRLEDKKYIVSREGESTFERGGRAKRYFQLTGMGVKALDEAQSVRSSLMGLSGGNAPWRA